MTSTNSTTQINAFTKIIKYDGTTKDFVMYLTGELVGYATLYLHAEMELNSLVHAILTKTATAATSDVSDEEVDDVLEAVYTPVMHDIDEMFLCLEADGSLEINARFIAQRPNVRTLSPKHVIALRVFFTMPRVAPTIAAAAAVRYAADEADRKRDRPDETHQMAAQQPKQAA